MRSKRTNGRALPWYWAAFEALLVGKPLLPVLAAGIRLPCLGKGAAQVQVMQCFHR